LLPSGFKPGAARDDIVLWRENGAGHTRESDREYGNRQQFPDEDG